MKGLNNVNMRKVLSELQSLKLMQQKSNESVGIMISICEDGSLDVNAKYKKGNQYITKTAKTNSIMDVFKMFPDIKEKAPVILDDMLLETDMYLPTEIILSEGKETVQKFIELALNHSEQDYMKAYIELFNEQFGIDEPDYSWKYPGSIRRFDGKRWSTDEEEKQRHFEREKKDYEENIEVIRDILKVSPMLLDFFDHYKKLTVEELVERYMDKQFFEPQPLK